MNDLPILDVRKFAERGAQARSQLRIVGRTEHGANVVNGLLRYRPRHGHTVASPRLTNGDARRHSATMAPHYAP